MVRTTGMGRSTITQYSDLVFLYHPRLKKVEQKKSKEKEMVQMIPNSAKSRKENLPDMCPNITGRGLRTFGR